MSERCQQAEEASQPETENMTTGEMIEYLSETVADAQDAYDDDDLETARENLAAVNNNIDGVLMQVNIEEANQDTEDDDG